MMTDSIRVCPDFQRRRVLCLLGSAALMLGSPLAHAVPAVAASAPAGSALTQIDLINLAVRQRTLIQRMTKLYAQVLVGARATDAKRLIQDSISRFDTLHTTHKSAASGMGSTNYQVTAVLDKISKAWSKLRADMAKPPTDKALPDICSQCEDLSRLINQSTGASAQFLSGSPIGQLVDRSGKQCYLSQRIAKNYFLRALDQSAEEASREIGDARKDFIENAAILAKAPENTTEIKFLLQLGATQWPYFDDAVSQSRKGSSELDYNVATTAENILEVLERTNLLYFKLSSSA